MIVGEVPVRLKEIVMKRWIYGLATLFLLGALVSCAASRDSALAKDEEEIVKAKSEGNLTKTLEKAEEHWKKRADKAELEKAIELFEKAVEMKSPNLSESERKKKLARGYERLSRAYYFKGDTHVRLNVENEKTREKKMKALFEKGVTAAESALVLRDSDLAKAVSGGEKLRKIVQDSDPSAIPGLYWYATNLGKWGLLEGIATILKYKDDIFETMKFICKEDPTFYYGGCHRYFGAYWTKVPFNKSPEKSKKHFDKSIEMAPEYLATKVLKANYYAELTQDPEMYKKLLNEVVESPDDGDPKIQPENKFEKEKAKRLLKQVEDKFY